MHAYHVMSEKSPILMLSKDSDYYRDDELDRHKGSSSLIIESFDKTIIPAAYFSLTELSDVSITNSTVEKIVLPQHWKTSQFISI